MSQFRKICTANMAEDWAYNGSALNFIHKATFRNRDDSLSYQFSFRFLGLILRCFVQGVFVLKSYDVSSGFSQISNRNMHGYFIFMNKSFTKYLVNSLNFDSVSA